MPPLPSNAKIVVEGGTRTVSATGLPDHVHGRFPNPGNPNPIVPQNKIFTMPAVPVKAESPGELGLIAFGVALNGVPFEPAAAEYWKSDRRSGWRYEALTPALDLGLDENHAHVQPNGKYHYHGVPTGLLKDGGKAPTVQLIGYAADGFPIYGPWGYADAMDAGSQIRQLRPSYRIKAGNRPGGTEGPGGKYDGRFVRDYEYVKGLGDLDAFNGRFGVTPEYPKGTWYYVVTEAWPYIARQFRGTPDDSFRFGPGADRGPQRQLGGPPQGRRGGRQGGPGRGGPPKNDPMTLLASASVASELRLDSRTREGLRRLAESAHVAGRAARSAGGSREPQDLRDRMKAARAKNEKAFDDWAKLNLSDFQISRWHQLVRQQQGMDYFISTEAKTLLEYGEAQFAEIYTTIVAARIGIETPPLPLTGRERESAIWGQMTQLLTPQQMRKLDDLLGKRIELASQHPPKRR
jgi:hypothetical protein